MAAVMFSEVLKCHSTGLQYWPRPHGTNNAQQQKPQAALAMVIVPEVLKSYSTGLQYWPHICAINNAQLNPQAAVNVVTASEVLK